jgi:hypothetical protein
VARPRAAQGAARRALAQGPAPTGRPAAAANLDPVPVPAPALDPIPVPEPAVSRWADLRAGSFRRLDPVASPRSRHHSCGGRGWRRGYGRRAVRRTRPGSADRRRTGTRLESVAGFRPVSRHSDRLAAAAYPALMRGVARSHQPSRSASRRGRTSVAMRRIVSSS